MYKVDLEHHIDQSTSHTVVSSVASLADTEPDQLEPLWYSVNPEALDSFVAHATDAGTSCRVAFQYEGYDIEIVGDGSLRIAPIEDRSTRRV
ncbi:HalOD1 output domain-containing protein [Natrarchaeobaculum aegyptiacum]|uniref:Halobacterial output domain-containing protein n=1 Tax=Natrarchaeobaculum aegyptiacum TaxID=745377 RepID=A0A2Z2HZ30_9EURY|nr:HalOD1 output domain-containing protein [Natrarchaeobaculum aegyptiacum]ARS88878.1 hypothetical protein B1756_03320 [Natrarchaeobaculum aegyptiacum]